MVVSFDYKPLLGARVASNREVSWSGFETPAPGFGPIAQSWNPEGCEIEGVKGEAESGGEGVHLFIFETTSTRKPLNSEVLKVAGSWRMQKDDLN